MNSGQITGLQETLCYFQSNREVQICEIQEANFSNSYFQPIVIVVLKPSYQLSFMSMWEKEQGDKGQFGYIIFHNKGAY